MITHSSVRGRRPRRMPRRFLPAAVLLSAVVVFCVDISSSYPVPAREQARATVAEALPELVAPGRKESAVYVYTIGVNTYQGPPRAHLHIPALDEKPASAAGNNAPLQGTKVSGKVRDFEKQWEDLRDRAMSDARGEAAKLKALSVSASEPGTDIGGCLKNASEQFSGRPHGTPLYLVIASDLAPDGTQQQSHAPISGARVRVVDFTCDEAVACDKRKTSWTHKLTGLGAVSVSVTRPGYDEHLFDAGAGGSGGPGGTGGTNG
ncbi:hypothetical protein ITX44_32040 [Streptomyces sp. KK5PA1]|uniref:Secreted protein n=1 Tax=Actinacidiphila acididurans TaxID=2784346 RepID=A0ABS2U0H0_9ACTN|nr:hypothetical protein [Actinacidiphila acididurans]